MYNIPPRSYFCSSVGNGLFNSASLDLPFAKTKSLVDAVTGSNLVDFTRQSSGTYVGSDGLIKTAVTNLLTYSEDFSNAEWGAASSATKVSATGVDDPFGGATASTWRNDGTGFADGGIRRTISGTNGLTYTYSIWIDTRSYGNAILIKLLAIRQQIRRRLLDQPIAAHIRPTTGAGEVNIIFTSSGIC